MKWLLFCNNKALYQKIKLKYNKFFPFTRNSEYSFSNKKSNYFFLLFTLIVPLIIIFTFIKLNDARGPYYLAYNSDPEYACLLNFLKVSEFKQPNHIEHPGTPLQLLGAILIKIKNITRNSSDVPFDVITNPEQYIFHINILLMLLVATITLFLGIFTYRLTRNIWYSIILQLSVFYTSNTYLELVRVRPDHLLLSISLMFVIIIISLLRANLLQKINNYIIAFSIISGLGLATKFVFFPILIIPFIVLPHFKNKVKYVYGTIIAFIVFTIPIIQQYPQLLRWIGRLFIHSGRYGSGSSTIIDFSQYFNNIAAELTSNAIFSIVLLIAIVFLFIVMLLPKLRKNSFNLEFKILIAVVSAQLVQLLLVAKHYNAHYLIPSLMLSGITIVLLLINIENKFNPKINKIVLRIGSIIGLMIFTFYSVITAYTISSNLEIVKNNSLSLMKEVEKKYSDYIKIYYFRSSSLVYALKFGNDFAGNEYSLLLNRYYPNNYFYNIWSKNYNGFGIDNLSFEEVIDNHSKIIFQGTSFEKQYYKEGYKPNVQLRDVYNGESETIYIVNLYGK